VVVSSVLLLCQIYVNHYSTADLKEVNLTPDCDDDPAQDMDDGMAGVNTDVFTVVDLSNEQDDITTEPSRGEEYCEPIELDSLCQCCKIQRKKDQEAHIPPAQTHAFWWHPSRYVHTTFQN